jgi:dTDP-4-amino-4,6-dideoxygalactose transaminase
MSKLALVGGEAVRKAPWPAWPFFEQDEIDAAANVLASGRVNYWTGDECKAFEREFAAYVGRRYCIALANGTLALELALVAYGIGPGDEVVVPSKTFIASASCVVVRGATPVIADIDPVTQGVSAETIAAVLTERTRAIIVVHLAGIPCDMAPIMRLAKDRGLVVIEDCAQAHGGRYRGDMLGSFGHCSAFSFCQDKIMTTGGEGGLFLTDDKDVWRRAWAYKDHGKSWATVHEAAHPAGFRWLHESFGTNWRMTEMQAAIGRRQLMKLDDWIERRTRNAALLEAGLKDVPGIITVAMPGWAEPAYYKYYAFVDPTKLAEGWNRTRIVDAIAAEGVPCFVGSCGEIYREKAFSQAGLGPEERLPEAMRQGETSLMFLIHPTLGEAEMSDACRAVKKVMAVAVGAG